MPTRPDSPRPDVVSFEPTTAYLHCRKVGDHFELSLIDDQGRRSQFRTACTSTVLDTVDELIAKAEGFTDRAKNWVESTSPTRRRTDALELQTAAEALGTALFPDPKEATFPGSEAARFLKKLKDSNAELIVVITLADKELTFPWNLVRLPGVDGWLGEAACFRMCRLGDGGLLDVAPHRDEIGVVVGYADDDGLLSGRPSKTLPGATQAELKALWQLTEKVLVLEDLPPGSLMTSALDKLQAWLSEPLHLFHFNGHASDPRDPEGYTEIGLRMGARVSGRDVRKGLAMTGAVVLDVCSGAQGIRRWWDNCFAACLHARGAPAVCASSSTVTDEFGTHFASELYKQVPLHGYKLFAALRAAQKELLAQTGHPMALYYTYEGSARFEIGRY